jgi:hypothetical protein
MITDEGQLQQTLEQMERMLRVLFLLRENILPQSRERFAMMAEGPLEQIRRLQQEIEAYVDEVLQPLEREMAALDEAAATPSVAT